MTVDVALAALTVAFVVYWRSGGGVKLFAVLVLSCLARDTGLLLVAGSCLFELLNRRLTRAVIWACAAVPMLAWYAYLGRIFPEKTHFGLPAWFASRLGPGLFFHMLHPPRYPLPPLLEGIARFGDVLALAAILTAALLAILFLRARPWGPVAISAALFTALVFALTNAELIWIDVNGYARIVSPLLILIVLLCLSRETGTALPWWFGLVPVLVVDLRLSFQFTSAIGGVLRGLLRL
jgi:hypothetical protein